MRISPLQEKCLERNVPGCGPPVNLCFAFRRCSIVSFDRSPCFQWLCRIRSKALESSRARTQPAVKPAATSLTAMFDHYGLQASASTERQYASPIFSLSLFSPSLGNLILAWAIALVHQGLLERFPSIESTLSLTSLRAAPGKRKEEYYSLSIKLFLHLSVRPGQLCNFLDFRYIDSFEEMLRQVQGDFYSLDLDAIPHGPLAR